jgi:hypothetical protein
MIQIASCGVTILDSSGIHVPVKRPLVGFVPHTRAGHGLIEGHVSCILGAVQTALQAAGSSIIIG